MQLRRDEDAHLTGFEVELHVADFPGVDESEDAGVEVAVLHASKLRTGPVEATRGKNGDGTLPSHRHEVAPAPGTGKGCGSARVSQRGIGALSSGRPARCVTRRRADQLLNRNAARALPAGRRQRGLGAMAPTGQAQVVRRSEIVGQQCRSRHLPTRLPEDPESGRSNARLQDARRSGIRVPDFPEPTPRWSARSRRSAGCRRAARRRRGVRGQARRSTGDARGRRH